MRYRSHPYLVDKSIFLSFDRVWHQCPAAKVGRSYCDQLFKLEEKWHDLSGEERLKKRQEEFLPLFEEFFTWVSQMHVIKQSLLGKALIYAKNKKAYLMNVLLDGNLHLSNNLAERSIRPLVVGRKAWYFYELEWCSIKRSYL